LREQNWAPPDLQAAFAFDNGGVQADGRQNVDLFFFFFFVLFLSRFAAARGSLHSMHRGILGASVVHLRCDWAAGIGASAAGRRSYQRA
jgi:hypothetical protein